MTSVYVISCIVALVLSSTAAVELKAIVTLYNKNENVGKVLFEEHMNGTVTVSGTIQGLSPGLHGFHIHEKGDVSDGCNNVGDHFNPENKSHGAPNDTERHVGDLGNIQTASNGTTEIIIYDNVITLVGPDSIIGRSLVVHNLTDDFGKGPTADSKKTGASGPKIACGVIGIQNFEGVMGTQWSWLGKGTGSVHKKGSWFRRISKSVGRFGKGDASSVWKSASALLLSIVVANVLM